MSKGRNTRVVTHRYGDKHNAVVYRLKKAAPKAIRGEASAYAQVIPQGTVEKREFAEKIAEASVGLNARTVEHMLDLMQDVLAEELRAGRQVALDKSLFFGVSMEGCISPEQPLEAKHLPLRPWVRFAAAFTEKINKGAAIRYAEPLQPAEVEVSHIEAIGENVFEAHGKFHNIRSLTVDIVSGETVLPCTLHLVKPKTSKRSIGKELALVAPQPLPSGELLFRFTWLDTLGDERTLDILLPR